MSDKAIINLQRLKAEREKMRGASTTDFVNYIIKRTGLNRRLDPKIRVYRIHSARLDDPQILPHGPESKRANIWRDSFSQANGETIATIIERMKAGKRAGKEYGQCGIYADDAIIAWDRGYIRLES